MTAFFRPFELDPFDLLWKDLKETQAHFSAITQRVTHPVDIYETENGIRFEVAAVGLNVEDIDISVENDSLRICYDKPAQQETQPIYKGIKRSGFDLTWKISTKFGTTINNLVRWNQISPSDSLSIGKELVILRDNKNKTELAKITNTGIDINRDIFYTVKEGDNLSRIAQKYNVKIAEIRSWNDLNEEYILQPGDKLTITINVVNSNLS